VITLLSAVQLSMNGDRANDAPATTPPTSKPPKARTSLETPSPAQNRWNHASRVIARAVGTWRMPIRMCGG
jgi:hypothetical protein